jgi:hypothetical protein
MVTKLFAAFLLSSTLLSGTAFAQTSPSPSPAPAPTASATTQPSSDLWRASKFSGLDVYNDKDEKVGDIAELMTDKNGKIEMVVVSVGGFLGMGQHDVAVKLADLKFMTEPRRPATTSAAPGGSTTGAGGTAATSTPARAAEPKNYPEYAVLANATKDSLKAMPAFKY